MDNLFRLINEKHYVGYYLPYNTVGEVADSILVEPFGLKRLGFGKIAAISADSALVSLLAGFLK